MKQGKTNAAIAYMARDFSLNQPLLVGRHVAGADFLKAWFQYAEVDEFFCYTRNQSDYQAFSNQLNAIKQGGKSQWIAMNHLQQLKSPGCLFNPDPNINYFARHRRHYQQDAYSICGITHSMIESHIIENIANLLIAPVQPWDAIICTSQAIKNFINTVLQNQRAYLSSRFQQQIPALDLQLPVIPLGIEWEKFMPTPEKLLAGKALRQQLNIADEDVVILYVGRLSYIDKANPLPMYQAVEQVAKMTKTKVHLLEVGCFQHQAMEQPFHQAVAELCPSINHTFLDGKDDTMFKGIKYAADIFMSLVDNIQETFGITPLEAMASGLPVIVSDWDGYRDTVPDGIVGFRIPTLMAAGNCGRDIALRYNMQQFSDGHYTGVVSQFTAVDTIACVQALKKLVEDKSLRVSMGNAGLEHVKNYAWQRIIAQYQALWQELSIMRQKSQETAPRNNGDSANPAADCPFTMYQSFPSEILMDKTKISWPVGMDFEMAEKIQQLAISQVAATQLCNQQSCQQILEAVYQANELTVEILLSDFSAQQRPRLQRSIVWLVKLGILQWQR